MTGNGPTTRLPNRNTSAQRDTWVQHNAPPPRNPHAPHPLDEPPQAYFEPATRPLRIERRTARTTPPPRLHRRRIDPTVVVAAIVMIALAVGVVVGLVTL
ncbi:hypothetical protein [Gordonia hankookensis]|uniref:Uncharacterized protein n=1 Tax=Gordonia hankookensis TaxID=589403 RepID=A0ABR7W8X0_9ACTN|nr:hypothetical protein [Gordonia hankookensis]MBD1319255.1 hypothetical protein [Gordonia hankookensis]